jgi:hypothetical protein
MKYSLFALIVAFAFIVTPALADYDAFTVMFNVTPKAYAIDYLPGNTTVLQSYNISTSENLTANQTWHLYGSDGYSFDLLDNQTDISFNASEDQFFLPCIVNAYRFFYIYFDTGFADQNVTTTLTLNRTNISTVCPTITPTPTSSSAPAPPFVINPPSKGQQSSQMNWLQSIVTQYWYWIVLLILLLMYLVWRKGR